MKKIKNIHGMTMAEVLIVVAIIAVLSTVAFVSISNYQRSLGQLERDGIAKEIFVAAQNHLTAAHGEGYLGITEFGTRGTAAEDADLEVYYFTVNGNISEDSALNQILPFGSIDETVRLGGSYIIRYQKKTGLVMDVFYCSRSGSPAQFNHELADSEYEDVLSLRDTEDENHKKDRRNWNGHILGWYGGSDAAELPKITLQAPSINVHNEEKLYVEVTNPNSDNTDALLKLIITGAESKAKKAYELRFAGGEERVKCYNNSTFTVILDDLTTTGIFSGMHFADITADTESTTGEKFIPGEDIEIQAVAYSTSALANIAYSSKNTTNSLFGGINSAKNTAYIENIRHFENLDKTISDLDKNDGIEGNDKIKIKAAEQTNDFSWINFQKANCKIISKASTGTESDGGYETIGVYNMSGTHTLKAGVGYYMPVEPSYELTYDGRNHSISDVMVDADENAGLFGSTSSLTTISNLELIDFSINGTTSAGALAGMLDGCTVTNVLARNKDNSAASLAKRITATGDAGGLIGKLVNGTVQYSAAAVIVNGNTNAGGLIGNANGIITGCYSGGHTANGSYNEWVKNNAHPYDVTGATAGGLVGTYTGTKIENSYSTSSVSGTIAGGFSGNASGNIANCYATGLVSGTTAQFAFLGSGNASLSGNYYYRTINNVPDAKPNAKEGDEKPMEPYRNAGEVSNHINLVKPIDLNADSYNTFTGAWDDWNPAKAFDAALVQFYSGKYTLKTVGELTSALPDGYENSNQLFVKTHYGDWGSPEVFFINE